MCLFASLLYDVALFFEDVSERCMSAAYWFWDFPGLGGVGDIFRSLEDFFWHIYWALRKAAFEVDNWWDVIYETRDWFYDLYDYAHRTLKGLIDDAVSFATDAYNYALEALELAQKALTEIPGWLLDQLEAAYNTAINAMATIEGFIADITQTIAGYVATWWESAKLTILDWIEAANATVLGWIEDTKMTVLSWIEDVKTLVLGWIEDAKAAVLAQIAAPINLISYWFDDIQDFFNSPLDWLLDRFGEWFFGQEK